MFFGQWSCQSVFYQQRQRTYNELIFTSGTEKKLWDSDNEACHEEERFPSPIVAPTNGSGAVLKTGK
jgi:hypothetical protein